MNRWKFLLSGATVFGFLCSLTAASGVRQRSDGCGPHPLIALAAASRPFATTAVTAASLNELLRAVRSDPDIWDQMQILLRRYDDCIRAGDGLHYKRSQPGNQMDKEILSSSPVLYSSSTQEFPGPPIIPIF